MASHLVIVTGGSSGIGRALIATCPYPDPQIIDLSRRGGGAAEHVEADLSTESGWDVAGRVFEQRVRGFDGDRVVCVLSAGTLLPIGPAGDVDSAYYRRNVMLNSAAPQVLGDLFLAATHDTEAQTDLVFIGSGAAERAYAGWSSYGASKAASAQWVRSVALELGDESSRRVWWIAPGVTATPMQADIRATDESRFPRVERFRRIHDDGQLRDPREVAMQLWTVLDEDRANGTILDLRSLLAH